MVGAPTPLSHGQVPPAGREYLLLNFGNGVGYFSYLAKTGYGAGAAVANFDDRAGQQLALPHD